MVDPLRGLDKTIFELIQKEYYFTIHAPRQTGKTTLLRVLAHRLNETEEYISVHFSIENAGYRSIAVDRAMLSIVESLYITASVFLEDAEMPPRLENYAASESLLYSYLSDWSKSQTKKIVLLIDEIDALYDDVLITVLRQLRNGFMNRNDNAFPVSVVLVGLRDVREYKEKVRDKEKSIGSGSPFNVKAESLTIGDFSRYQIGELLKQYTDEGGQIFPDEIIDILYGYTGGQPWLVNALAREITEKVLFGDAAKPITIEVVNQAKENLILRRDTHLDSLMDKLREPRVKPIIENIISGNTVMYDDFNDDLLYTEDLGLITRDKTGIRVSNQIYNEIIPRVLSMNFQESMLPTVEREWYIKADGKLDMGLLLKEFQKFYRRHSESWLGEFSFRESGRQLLLMAFLQRVVNGGGNVEREMALGSGRCDLLIEYAGERFVIEMKINHDSETLSDGKDQISRYLDKLGLNHGYLILFETKKSAEIPWEGRIKWTELEHEWKGITKQISLVEM